MPLTRANPPSEPPKYGRYVWSEPANRWVIVRDIESLRNEMQDRWPDGPPPAYAEGGEENYPDWHDWHQLQSVIEMVEKKGQVR